MNKRVFENLEEYMFFIADNYDVILDVAFSMVNDSTRRLYDKYFDTFDVIDEWCEKEEVAMDALMFKTIADILMGYEVSSVNELISKEFVSQLYENMEALLDCRDDYELVEKIYRDMVRERLGGR